MAKKRYRLTFRTGITILFMALAAALLVSNTETFRQLELSLLDTRFRLRGSIELSDSPVVILAIDDQSDESTPDRWPWPREYFARVIRNLNRAGARVIGVDVIFDQPDRHGDRSDEALRSVLEHFDNVVLAGKIRHTSGRMELNTLVPPHKLFRVEGGRWGLVSSEIDPDGIFRRYILRQTHLDTVYDSFVAEIIQSAVETGSGSGVEVDRDHFRIGSYSIPKFDRYSFLIDYAGPAFHFPYYPFDNVLDDTDFDLRPGYDIDAFDDPGDPELGIPPGPLYSGAFRDKIVLIGSTMPELHDDFPTPFLETTDETGVKKKALMPGVEVHANALQTILDRRFITRLKTAYQLALLVAIGLIVYGLSTLLPTLLGAIGTVCVLFAYSTAGLWFFVRHRLILDMTSGIFIVVFAFIGYHLVRFYLTQKEKRLIQGAFSHYVPEKVVAQIIENPDMLSLGGESRVVTVLFSDVAGFTSLSEKMAPDQLVDLLNEYLTEMSEIVLKNDGIIDKFEGDAIMAEFGVPVHDENHAYLACKTALEMQHRLAALREAWHEAGRPLLRARIGINTGEVIVGNLGSRNVFDYTVIGDAVNLGSRLEGANKQYGTSIMISQYTFEEVKEAFHTRQLDVIRVLGKKEPIRVYELVEFAGNILLPEKNRSIRLFQRGVARYGERDWDGAIRCFQDCLKLDEGDRAAAVYLQRCKAFMECPPDEAWDGVTTLTEK